MLNFIKRNVKFVVTIGVSFVIIAGLTTALIVTNVGHGGGRGRDRDRSRNRDSVRIEMTEEQIAQHAENTRERQELRAARGERDSTGEQRTRGQRGSDEQRAEREALAAKWDALTEAQRAQIFDLNDQKMEITNQIIDRYLALGIIDAETAASMKEANESHAESVRENSGMPLRIRAPRGERAERTERAEKSENGEAIENGVTDESTDD